MGLKEFFNSVFGSQPNDNKRVGESGNSFDNLQLSSLLNADGEVIRKIVKKPEKFYQQFRMRKRRGGYRTISAPQQPLLSIQRRIYQLLVDVPVHPAAKGFRRNLSVVDNAKVHVGHKNVLKVDISSFFGTIQINKVIPVFESLGYNRELSKQLAQLCCLSGRLPQGAPTSPVLSNAVVFAMDTQLEQLAQAHNVAYSRYADDLVFSGEFLNDELFPKVRQIIEKEGFLLNNKKTQYLAEKQRKIITGVSISSGKLTIPKAKKRELRQKIHYLLTRGVDAHKAHIKSTDKLYVERVIGHLCFWLSVEPDNQYVKKSIKALRELLNKAS